MNMKSLQTIKQEAVIEWIPEISHFGMSLASPTRKVYIGTMLKKEEYVGLRKFILDEINYQLDLAVREALSKADGETSDGFHTFNELYSHRHTLFAVLCYTFRDRAWKSMKHEDGTMFDGWFIAGIETLDGQATYHLPLEWWGRYIVKELPHAPKWDGHTPEEARKRLLSLTALSEQEKIKQEYLT